MGFKFPDTLSLIGRGFGCLILAFIKAWKFTIVFVALIPVLSGMTTFLVIMIKKYTVKEFAAYGSAGRIAQEALSSIKTVYT